MRSSWSALVLLFAACTSDKAEPAKTEAPSSPAATAPTVKQPDPPKDEVPRQTKTVYSFKVNGTVVNTKPVQGDSDEPIMSVNLTSNHGFFAIYGDVEGSPRRAFVTFDMDNFKPEPAEYKARATFNRNLDKKGGKSISWHSKKERATFKITSLVEKEKNPLGTKWLAAGTFEAKGMELAIGQQSATATIDITEGTFTDLEVQTLGKQKP